MTDPNDRSDPADAAIARRLARLGAMPVDTSALDRALRARIPPAPARPNWRRWTRVAAIAASLILVAALAFALLQPREAQASPALMAQMHLDIVSGKTPTVRAQSIDDANHIIAAMNGASFSLPEPPSHTMACCMQKIGNKKVACVLLDDGGTPVTMAVANAAEVESPNSPTVQRQGTSYHVQTVGNLQMIMTEREHRWVCLIGAVPQDKLMDLADAIHF